LELNFVKIEEFQNAQIIEMGKQQDARGSLSFIEFLRVCSFAPKRLFFLDHFTEDATRGSHAHKACQQILFVLRGEAQINVDDGHVFSRTILKNDNRVLLVKAMTWLTIVDVPKDSLILVAASDEYDESDYLRSREEFEVMVNAG
jgi:UDP-2-acetamido-3-amino-2,3-dideoxy-glucuronate N-acetyltransferase